MGQYKGLAAKLSAGTEAFEADNAMAAHNFTLVVTGAPTVSVVGGWAQGGGHSSLSSLYGLGSDQLLSLNVVTADGRFITADATHNQELFFALRGGGPGTTTPPFSVSLPCFLSPLPRSPCPPLPEKPSTQKLTYNF